MKKKKPSSGPEPTIIDLILAKNPTLAKHFEDIQWLDQNRYTQQILLFSDPDAKIKLTENIISELRKRIIHDPLISLYGAYNLTEAKFDEALGKMKSVNQFQAKNHLNELKDNDIQSILLELGRVDESMSEEELTKIIQRAGAVSQQDSLSPLKLMTNSDSPTKTMVYLMIEHHYKLKELSFLEEQLLELKRLTLNDSAKGEHKDFTTARQVLAIHYLMEELDVYKNTDKTEIARFIQFLTSKELGCAKINDTTIYKRVKNPFSENDKQLESDLRYIRNYFEKLGIKPIVFKITKEIGSKE